MHPTNRNFTGTTTEEIFQCGHKVIITSKYHKGMLISQKCSQPEKVSQLDQLIDTLKKEHLPSDQLEELDSLKISSSEEESSDEEYSSSSDETPMIANATISGVNVRSYLGQGEDGKWGTFTIRTYGNGEERTTFKPQLGNQLSLTASVITTQAENYKVTSSEEDVGAGAVGDYGQWLSSVQQSLPKKKK